jgi:UDP-N-acetylmuramate--alanine ligase
VTYGTDPAARWRIVDLEHGQWDVGFRLIGPDGAHEVRVPRPGMHMARNAAGVLALFGELGFDVAAAATGLAGFGGVHRRFEVKARLGGVTVVDDYAHHPTEIAATLEAGRLGKWNRVWAVFQPHRYSRTEVLATEFGAVLARADRIIVTDVYPADERPIPGVTGRLVADAVADAGGSVEYVPARRDLAAHLVPQLAAGDLVVLLGAGDITAAADELALALGRGR